MPKLTLSGFVKKSDHFFKVNKLYNQSYYRQLSADIKIQNTRLKRQVEPNALANKTGINNMIFILIFIENWL